MKKYIALGSIMVFMPLLTFAKTFSEIIGVFNNILKVLMPFLIGLSVLYFIISLIKYISKEGEEKTAAKDQMIWGIIILFAMVSVWGLVNILKDTFKLGNEMPDLPELPGRIE